ncbi:hypothetical protein Tcan_11590 [Toxocara canis]|uniref:Pepsin inhibitor-3-like repeated domain-containing protein n=1 Tax=Toxocara canis TaxID=6265 RepID=A0A0B2VSJ8_TOXCA|nr:hypothetical protein Tcan_11590 [Toxocara canis]
MNIFRGNRAVVSELLLFGIGAVLCAPASINMVPFPIPSYGWGNGDGGVNDYNDGIFPNAFNTSGFPLGSRVTWFDIYQFSANCSVQNGTLFIDGISKGPLTPQQQEELQRFLEQTTIWNQAFMKSIMQQIAQGLGGIFGQESTMQLFQPNTEQSNTQLALEPTVPSQAAQTLPPFPELPSFCKAT